jgi:hypothetical protein
VPRLFGQPSHIVPESFALASVLVDAFVYPSPAGKFFGLGFERLSRVAELGFEMAYALGRCGEMVERARAVVGGRVGSREPEDIGFLEVRRAGHDVGRGVVGCPGDR